MESPSVEQQVQEILASQGRAQGDLIPILQAVQGHLGYLPEEAMRQVAEYLGIPESNVYGVASFYAQFRFSPVGKTILTVCRGTACHVRGAAQVADEVRRQLGVEVGETTPDLEFTLETVACIGACGLAPCMTVDQEVHGRLAPAKVGAILAAATGGTEDAG